MKEPKYKIGDVFYVMTKFDNDRGHYYEALPTIFVIEEIKITKTDIIYGVKQYYAQTNELIQNGKQDLNEKEIDKTYLPSENDLIKGVVNKLEEGFAAVRKEIDKEKLTKVLHGE